MTYAKDQHASLLLAGTVALPSPFPATGRVSVGVYVHDDGGDPDIYLDLVQVVDSHRSITRTIRFADVRAIRAASGSTPAHEAPLQTARQLASKVEAMAKALAKGSKNPTKPEEELLFERAIVYLPEHSPVLHRAQLGITAGESAEDFGYQGSRLGCCESGISAC